MERKTTAKIMLRCKRGFCKGKFSVLTSARSWPPLWWLHISSKEDGTPAKPTADVSSVVSVRCPSTFLLQDLLHRSNENGNHLIGRAPCWTLSLPLTCYFLTRDQMAAVCSAPSCLGYEGLRLFRRVETADRWRSTERTPGELWPAPSSALSLHILSFVSHCRYLNCCAHHGLRFTSIKQSGTRAGFYGELKEEINTFCL